MNRILNVIVCFTLVLLATPMSMAESFSIESTTNSKVQWPKESPLVSIDLAGVTRKEALEALVKKADWGIMIQDEDCPQLQDKVTLKLDQQRASDVAEMILDDSGIDWDFRGNVLVIKGNSRSAGGEFSIGDIKMKIRKHSDPQEHFRRDSNRHKRSFYRHSDNEMVVVGKSATIEANQTVDEAVVLGGSLRVKGKVDGDAVAIGGSITLEPGSVVEGDAVAVGGKIKVESGATLRGDRTSISGPFSTLIAGLVKNAKKKDGNIKIDFPDFGFWGKVMTGLAIFLLGLLFLTFMPKKMDKMKQIMNHRPGASALGGLAIVFGFVPLLVLLCITLIGIPLVPVAILLAAVMFVLGLSVLAIWLGERIPLFQDRKTPVVGLALGVGVLILVQMIPFVGGALYTLGMIFAAGSVLISRFGFVNGAHTPPNDQQHGEPPKEAMSA